MTDLFDKPLGGEGEGWSPGRKIETVAQPKSYRHDNFEVTGEDLGRFNCQGEYKLPQPAFDVQLAEAWLRGYDQGFRAQLATARADALREAEAIADKHLARIAGHCPDEKDPEDLVAHGYGNAALNIRHELRALIDKEPDA